jgi:hypothetical protein
MSFAQAFGLDWQFFLVTAVALWGLWTIVRQFLPAGLFGDAEPEGTSPCGHCAAGAACISRLHREGEDGGSQLVTLGGGRHRSA